MPRIAPAAMARPARAGGRARPDLVRSLVVLDDEKGTSFAPVLRNGRPDQECRSQP